MASDISLEKILPSNLEAERSVLGAILLDEKAIFSVLDSLRKEDFYLEGHRKIYEKMSELSTGQRPIDLITLKNELQRSDDLERAGGPAYLASLTDGLPRAINIEHYAQIVKADLGLAKQRVLEDVERWMVIDPGVPSGQEREPEGTGEPPSPSGSSRLR